MRRVLASVVVVIAAGAAWTLIHAQTGTASTRVPMRPGVGYYTDAQAAREKPKFEKECSDCHTVDPKKPPRVSYGGSLVSGFRAIAEKQ